MTENCILVFKISSILMNLLNVKYQKSNIASKAIIKKNTQLI